MSHDHFHVRRGQRTYLDQEGLDRTDLEEAARCAWEIPARERMTDLRGSNRTIVDKRLQTVLELPFEGEREGGKPAPLS